MTRPITPLPAADVPALAELLAANGLPTDDLTAPGRRFWRVVDAEGLLGYGGLESYGADGLLAPSSFRSSGAAAVPVGPSSRRCARRPGAWAWSGSGC